QGGAMVLHTGLRYFERLLGIIALLCYLLLGDTLAVEASSANCDVLIFMVHGTDDSIIPLDRARRSCDKLTDLGYRVTWREYPMAHSVCEAEVDDLSAWLSGVLGEKGEAR